jgi:hypothetical protein
LAEIADEQLARLRRICLSLPGAWEKLSHGEPTFFAGKKVFATFANNHHGDGHIAVWLPVPPGHQEQLTHLQPAIYFRPPYVGVRGWVGIELQEIDDDALGGHLAEAWKLIKPAKKPIRASTI